MSFADVSPKASLVRFGLLALALAISGSALTAEKAAPAPMPPRIRGFTAKSFGEIRKANAGRPAVVAFWSVHCEPCRGEMKSLVQLRREFPQVRVVLVAADPADLRKEVERVLKDPELADLELWHFDDEMAERLRYSIDRTWRGELPRTYFIDAAGEIAIKSGAVELSWMKQWAKRASPEKEI